MSSTISFPLTSDPRNPSRITRYENKLSNEELPSDFLSLISLISGVIGLMLRYKLAAWIALFACMASIVNMRKSELDFKQVTCSILFACMGLIMCYFGVKPGIPGS